MTPSARSSRPHRFTRRSKLVALLQARLQAQSWPRVQMSLIVSFTGLAGLLASAVLLKLGMHSMAVRYPLATLVAYGAFLGLLWLWMHTRADDWGDAAQLADGGDGLDGAYGVDAGADTMDMATGALRGGRASASSRSAKGLDLGDIGDAGSADELAVVLLVLVAVASLALAGVYVVTQAPTLLAEVALDGAVVGSLYHRLHQAERQHWALSAWGYTRGPLLFLLIVMALVGWGLQHAAPGAATLGQALSMLGA